MTVVSTYLHYSAVTSPAGDFAAVVIDVLRATTTVCAALYSGATGIIPVIDEESAYDNANRFDSTGKSILLGGERDGNKIPGFHFGNSPTEYSSIDLTGTTLIHLTTNGTSAISKLIKAGAGLLYAAAFVNLSATVQALIRINVPITVVCSGSNDSPCLEDTLCAGAIIREMRKIPGYDFDDTSLIAADLYDRNIGNVKTVLLNKCKHGKYLSSIGFEEDVKYASRLDLFDFAVRLNNGILVKSNAKF